MDFFARDRDVALVTEIGAAFHNLAASMVKLCSARTSLVESLNVLLALGLSE